MPRPKSAYDSRLGLRKQAIHVAKPRGLTITALADRVADSTSERVHGCASARDKQLHWPLRTPDLLGAYRGHILCPRNTTTITTGEPLQSRDARRLTSVALTSA